MRTSFADGLLALEAVAGTFSVPHEARSGLDRVSTTGLSGPLKYLTSVVQFDLSIRWFRAVGSWRKASSFRNTPTIA